MKIDQIKNILFLSTVLLVGCETVMDVNIELEKPMLVVNSVFNKDSVWRVDVSLTRHVLSNYDVVKPVSNATVSILDEQTNEVLEVLTLSQISSGGVYRGKLKPEVMKNYKVNVDVNGYASAESAEHVPELVPLTQVDIDEDALQSTGVPVPVKIYFTDPVAVDNFYQLKAAYKTYHINYPTGDTIWYTYPLHMNFEDPALTENDEYVEELLLTDRLFNGKEHTISFNLDQSVGGEGTISICFNTISESYYDYETTLKLQRQVSGDPFSQPVQVFTNIKNGLGIFAGYNPDEWKIKKNP